MKHRTRIVAGLHKSDAEINKWLDTQDNISKSIRLLILQAVRDVGYVDYIDALLLNQTEANKPYKKLLSHPEDKRLTRDKIHQVNKSTDVEESKPASKIKHSKEKDKEFDANVEQFFGSRLDNL